LADSAAVINQGCIEQDGKTDDVFQGSLTPFRAEVASMKNVFEATREAISSANCFVGDSFSCHSLHLGYLLVYGACGSIAQDLSTDRPVVG
jgi:ABC-type Fe3+/spermidine/putrescine transport system ATPase subunit